MGYKEVLRLFVLFLLMEILLKKILGFSILLEKRLYINIFVYLYRFFLEIIYSYKLYLFWMVYIFILIKVVILNFKDNFLVFIKGDNLLNLWLLFLF